MCGIHAQTDRSGTVCSAVSSSATGGVLHGCHGVVASTVYSRDTWTPTVVFMQHVHDVFRLFSGPSEVKKAELGAVIFSPRGKERGVVDIVLCVHLLPPKQTSAYVTLDMTLFDNVHSGDAIGSFV